jgi:hypothetical protein
MKRVLVLAACVLFTVAANASASWVLDDGYIRGTVTPYSSNVNKVDISFISTGFPSGLSAISLKGTFSVNVTKEASASLYLGGTTSNWASRTTNNSQAAQESFVNFDSKAGTFSYVGTLPTVNSFTGTWYTSDAAGSALGVGSTLATIYVQNGSEVKFNGTIGFRDASFNSTTQSLVFAVPEPSTVAILITGCIALIGAGLARARRS